MFDVQFITHFTPSISYLESARIALRGGCRWIQLRMKDAPEDELEDTALRVQHLCRQYHNATFIIDDHVDLAKQIGAHGVHLGKLDMPIKAARERLGHGFIIGATANTFDDISQHAAHGANYIGCGPFRFTTTKQRLSPILGTDGYRAILTRMQQEGLSIPIVAIGGITREDIPELKALGLSGIALSGGILKAENPVREMETIIRLTQ
ncbi:thiamine phosphate synthase [Bacteroides sp. UBA939]|uniref:thiamine phosphate synthase n=1 Tax=Bacteroides sp. UBA939 TaxID=1946092 RepID=UPI0025B83C62|nr:thiamine phosphate synthase [Bacteroides sp. UBA939]